MKKKIGAELKKKALCVVLAMMAMALVACGEDPLDAKDATATFTLSTTANGTVDKSSTFYLSEQQAQAILGALYAPYGEGSATYTVRDDQITITCVLDGANFVTFSAKLDGLDSEWISYEAFQDANDDDLDREINGKMRALLTQWISAQKAIPAKDWTNDRTEMTVDVDIF